MDPSIPPQVVGLTKVVEFNTIKSGSSIVITELCTDPH